MPRSENGKSPPSRPSPVPARYRSSSHQTRSISAGIPMLTSRARLTAAAFIALMIAPIYASSPKFFQASTEADFLKGELENLALDTGGELVLGPSTELIYETSAPFLWSMLAAP